MTKRIIPLAVAGAAAAAMLSAAATAAVPPDRDAGMWNRACVDVAKGQVFPNPGPLDCENPRTVRPNFSGGALVVMQHLCEQALGGSFVHRSETTEHVYCFLS